MSTQRFSKISESAALNKQTKGETRMCINCSSDICRNPSKKRKDKETGKIWSQSEVDHKAPPHIFHPTHTPKIKIAMPSPNICV